jgi:hypothetical protein
MRTNHFFIAALSVVAVNNLLQSRAEAGWTPSLPQNAEVIVEIENQTSPLELPRGDLREDAGGVLGAFKANSVSRDGVLLRSWPVEVRISKAARLQVRNLKTLATITHPTALSAGTLHFYQVSCTPNGWSIVVDGKTHTDSDTNHSVCVSRAWGKAYVGSGPSGSNPFEGALDLTWYVGEGTGGSTGDGGGSTGDGGSGDETQLTTGVSWKADHETGNASQWSALADLHAHSINVINARSRGGRFGIRMEVRYLDRGLDANGEPKKVRAEVMEKPVRNNTTWWYGWSSMIDPAWRDQNNTWYVIQQFHQNKPGGSPPIFQRYAGGKWSIRCLEEICGKDKKVLWQAAMPKDKWVDWVYQIKWSPNSDGMMRVWKDGTLIVDYKGKTCHDARNAPYFKAGVYRGGRDQNTQIIWYDEYRRGNSKSAVDPRNYF